MHLPVGVLGVILWSVTAHAQNPLAYTPDARVASLAGSGAALSGPAALWINPAGVGGEYDWSFGASVLQLTGISRVKVATGHAHYRKLAIHLAAARVGDYAAHRYGLSYARPISPKIRIGGGLAVFRQGVAGYWRQTGVVARFGGQFKLSDALRLGAYTALPSDRRMHEVRVGAGFRYAINADVSLLLDVLRDGEWGWSTHSALRYAPSESLILRLGYDGAAGAFSLGCSFALGNVGEADVAARYHPRLGTGGGAGIYRAGIR